MKVIGITATCLFAFFLPILLVSSNLRFMISEINLYEYGFDKYKVNEVTGIENDELIKAASELIHYFNSEENSAQIQVMKDGQEINLFSEREIIHLGDVKSLIQLFYLAQWITLAYAVSYIIAGLIIRKRAFLRKMMQGIFFGGIFTLALLAFVGIWALIDFEGLFLTFHLTSFQNELWMLNPAKDYLIMMFPEGFFFDAALFLVSGTVVEALILAGITWAHLRGSKRRKASKVAR